MIFKFCNNCSLPNFLQNKNIPSKNETSYTRKIKMCKSLKTSLMSKYAVSRH